MHQVAILFQGNKHSGNEESWAAYRWATFRSLNRDHGRELHEHVKLFSPTKEVLEVLEMIGFTSLFEIYTDLSQGVASFRQSVPAIEASYR
jgi:hypothetical protein